MTADGGRPPAQVAHRRAQPPLGEAEHKAARRHEDALRPQLQRIDPVRGQGREGTPRGRKPQARVKPAAEELEVVGHHDERPHGDERHEAHRHRRRADDPDRHRPCQRHSGQADEHAVGQLRAQWSAVELVQRVRAHSHPEEERREGRRQSIAVELWRRDRPEGDVAQMPGRVRRVQQRDDVRDLAAPDRVEGRSLRPGDHALSPGSRTSRRRRRGSCAGRGWR